MFSVLYRFINDQRVRFMERLFRAAFLVPALVIVFIAFLEKVVDIQLLVGVGMTWEQFYTVSHAALLFIVIPGAVSAALSYVRFQFRKAKGVVPWESANFWGAVSIALNTTLLLVVAVSCLLPAGVYGYLLIVLGPLFGFLYTVFYMLRVCYLIMESPQGQAVEEALAKWSQKGNFIDRFKERINEHLRDA